MTVGLLSFAAVSPYEGSVASRARLFHQSADAANFYLMSRSAHIATENLTAIKPVFGNFYTDSSGHDAGAGASSTITASVEYPAGTFSQIKFSSSATGTVPDINILFSDSTSVSIPSGATFWIRCFVHNTSGIFYNSWQNAFLGEATAISSTAISDQTMSGTISNSGSFSFPPMAILGTTVNPSVVIVGDSAGVGASPSGHDTEDSSNSATGFNAKVGLVARSLGNIPFINICAGAQVAQGWQANSPARAPLITKGSHLICEMGINDLLGDQRTAAQLSSDVQAIFALGAASQKKYQTTITPLTTSTDAFATLVNQTLRSTDRVNFNTLVRAGVAPGIGFFDVASAVESGLNSGKWVVTPTPPYTDDGIHAILAGNLLVVSSGVISGITLP